MKTHTKYRLCLSLALVASAAGLTLRAQTPAGQVEFTAFAVNMNTTGAAAASTVQIVIERWSTEAEHAQLLTAFRESGTVRQFSALQQLRPVGYIRTPDSIRYELHYARQIADADGGRQIFIASDRTIGFWEAAANQRTIDYPFTLIEMHIGHGRPGEGKMSLATKVTVDRKRNLVQLENYSAQPVLLQNVEERKK
jgi:hypothetical protein